MGQKVNPIGLRVGIIRDWESKWYASPKDFSPLLYEDYLIRKTIKELPVYREPKWVEKKVDGNVVTYSNGQPVKIKQKEVINAKDIITLSSASIASIQIERPAKNRIKVTVNAAKPGIIIGKGGAGIDNLRKAIEKIVTKNSKSKEKVNVTVNVLEIKNSEKNAQIVAESIQAQIEKRVSFKRAMKQAVKNAYRAGSGDTVKGIKIRVSGRLGGAEMARVEKENAGKVPLHTLRADIDYGFAEAWTQYGHIGIKVWIYNGDITDGKRVVATNAKPFSGKGKKGGSGKKNFRRDGNKAKGRYNNSNKEAKQ